MSITSIGYGDISPQRSVEYVVCIFGMLFGGILWAYIIGTICGVVSSLFLYSNFLRNKSTMEYKELLVG